MQFRDQKFNEALASLRYKTTGPWILGLPRDDIDPASRARIDFTSHVGYEINAKKNQVAMMHVLGVGKGRVRLGYREHIPVSVGDLVLVNLREAGHWITLDGRTYYLFTGDVPFARVFRTTKTIAAPEDPEARKVWADEWYWNISDILSDYVLLGRDPKAEQEMAHGKASAIHRPETAAIDGVRSDNQRDNRFPIVYRRVLGVGPGKWLTRESDLGIVEREETKSEAKPGDMMALCKSVAAASFTFQGCPFDVIHAASVLVHEKDGTLIEYDRSATPAMTWTDPNDTPVDEDPEAEAAAPEITESV